MMTNYFSCEQNEYLQILYMDAQNMRNEQKKNHIFK